MRVPGAGGEITRPIGGRLMLYGYTTAKNGAVAATITTPERPSEIFTLGAEGGGPEANHVYERCIHRTVETHDARVRKVQEQGWNDGGRVFV